MWTLEPVTLELVGLTSLAWARMTSLLQSQDLVHSSSWMNPLLCPRSSSPLTWLPQLNSHRLLLLQSRVPAPGWLWTLPYLMPYLRSCPLHPALWI